MNPGTRAAFVRLGCVLALLMAGGPAGAAIVLPDGFSNEIVANGLALPVGMAFLPGGRLLVVEQRSARIMLVQGPAGSPATVVGTVTGVQSSANEAGLLGIAADPRWPAKPYIYVHFTSTGAPGHVQVARYTLTGDLAETGSGLLTLDDASRFDLITDVPDIAPNHNGGTLRFGTDGRLYASFGEDGNSCAAQDSVTMRGVILRLDVTGLPDGPGSATRAMITPADNPFVASSDPEERLVWALGLRNPFRFQIDPQTGALDIADVGEDSWEELDYAPTPGLDFGWPYREGRTDFSTCPGTRPALTEPVFVFGHAEGDAIMAAGVYRNPNTLASAAKSFPAAYEGHSFASDFYDGELFHLVGLGATRTIAAPVPGQATGTYWATGLETVADYCVGPDGALWYCRQASSLSFPPNTGEIGRIVHPNDSTTGPPTRVVVLRPAFPVPAAASVRLDFALSIDARVSIVIYDLRGRRTRELVRPETRTAGSYTENWDGLDDEGRRVEAGLYFARLSLPSDDVDWRIVIAR